MKKVLIVDDHDGIRRMFRLALSGRYQLFEAANADDAWELMRQTPPDAVLLDIMMPGELDGAGLCRKIRSDRQFNDTYIIMVTACAQRADREDCLAAGANDYMVKPFSPLQLARQLDTVLERKPDSPQPGVFI